MTRGRFYLRSESAECDFIRSLKAPLPFDAAIASDRYLADYPDGHARYGEDRPNDRIFASRWPPEHCTPIRANEITETPPPPQGMTT
jgi:hypothetical protein